MAEIGQKEEQERLRELARRTLEAFRELNRAAAAASLLNGDQEGAELARASKLLDEILADLKRIKSPSAA